MMISLHKRDMRAPIKGRGTARLVNPVLRERRRNLLRLVSARNRFSQGPYHVLCLRLFNDQRTRHGGNPERRGGAGGRCAVGGIACLHGRGLGIDKDPFLGRKGREGNGFRAKCPRVEPDDRPDQTDRPDRRQFPQSAHPGSFRPGYQKSLGGSGVPSVQRAALAAGSHICKFNTGTALRMVFGAALRTAVNRGPSRF